MYFFFPPWIRHGRPNTATSVFSVDIQPHGTRLATAGQDCSVKLWHLPLLARLAHHFPPHSSRADAVPPDPSTSNPTPPPGALLSTLTSHTAAVNVVRWAPNGSLLASAGDDHVVLVYSLSAAGQSAFAAAAASETWDVRRPLRAHSSDVTDLAWSPDSERLASASVDNSIIVWNLRADAPLVRLDGHRGLVKGLAWDPVGRYLASQSDDRTVRIWRTVDWKVDKVISKPFETAVFQENSMTFFLRIGWSPCGTQLVATNAYRKPGTHHAPLFSRASDFDVEIEFVGHREPVISTRFSPRLYRPHPAMVRKLAEDMREKNATAESATVNAANGTTASAEAPVNAPGEGVDGKLPERLTAALSGGATYTVLALGSKDGGCSVWQASSTRPFFEMTDVFDMEVIDLSWGSDGYSLSACSTDGKVLYIRFEPEELGLVVPPTEARSILTDVWRSLGATAADGQPLAESAQQLEMESQNMKKDAVPIDRTAPTSIPDDDQAPTTTIPRQPESNPAVSSAPVASPPSNPMDDKPDHPVPEPVRAAAAAARQNGPTPPADPSVIAAQAETRVRGGKRRIVPVSVTPAAQPALSTGPTPIEISETVAEPTGPFKRPRASDPPAEDSLGTFARNAAAARAAGTNAPNGGSHPLPTNGVASHQSIPTRTLAPPGAKAVSHAAHLYAPSVAGLSLMLLSDRSDGPGRCRVISSGDVRVVLESREQHGGGGGYTVVCSAGGKVKWRDYHPKSSPVTALAGVAGKHVAVGTADGMLYLHSATSGRRLTPPIAIDSAPYMLEAIYVRGEDADYEGEDDSDDTGAWYVVVVSRSALVSVFDVKGKKLVCARSAASLLARPLDAETVGKEEAIGAQARIFREIAHCRVTKFGEPILVLSDGHAFVYSRDFCSWLRVADDSSPNSEYRRSVPPSKRVGILRSLQSGIGARSRPLPSLSGMGDLRRAAVESLAHLESLMESAVVLGSASDYRYYLTNYAARISAAVSDDVESCTLRLRELCDDLLKFGSAKDPTVLGMSGRELLKETVLPVISVNRNMQRIVTEYMESIAEVESEREEHNKMND